jgi:hypothetical protein
MFSSRTIQALALTALLLAAQLGGCKPGVLAPAPFPITHAGEVFEVRRHAFLPSGGFVDYAPVEVSRPVLGGIALTEKALAEAVLDAYCATFGFERGPPAAIWWSEDGTWHFVRGCARRV